MTRSLRFFFLSLAWLAGCRGCDNSVQNLKPSIAVTPSSLDFGPVKLGSSAELSLDIAAQTQAALLVSPPFFEAGGQPGGVEAFTVLDAPDTVPALSHKSFRVRFTPQIRQAYEAILVIPSNDESAPQQRILLTGSGDHPRIEVTPDCAAELGCKGTATLEPPALNFGTEPRVRLLPIPLTELPGLTVVNAGDVELTIHALSVAGTDASAFTFQSTATFPVVLQKGEGFNVRIRFVPTSDVQTSYSAEAVVQSDDPDKPEIRVGLSGTLRPNLPPVVCANVIRVRPADNSGDLNYDAPGDWAPLLIPPVGGYDFTRTRDIQPKSMVNLSALSSATDVRTCTSDPEDGRTLLQYEWKVTQWPQGPAPQLSGVGATASFVPVASGEYTLSLKVSDALMASTTVALKIAVAIKQDLVAELSWNGADGGVGVDLDLHLIRPSSTTSGVPFSGAFSFFNEAGSSGKTSGDLNGYALLKSSGGTGDFNWGGPGIQDDPRLNLDDQGLGQLVENISLNYPENDPACQTARCAYKVMVHYYKDQRSPPSPPPCSVTACQDGDACDCANGLRCVAKDAPAQSAPTGAGTCYAPPQPQVRLFIKAQPTPAKVIPIPAQVLTLNAPCQMLYVADVIWPAKSELDGGLLPDGGLAVWPDIVVQGANDAGVIVAPRIARYGVRSAGSLSCVQNVTQSGVPWYDEEPL